jgi:hypothetical protein
MPSARPALPPGCPSFVADALQRHEDTNEIPGDWWLPCTGESWPDATPPCEGYYWFRERGLPGPEIAYYVAGAWLSLCAELPDLSSLVVDSAALIPPSNAVLRAYKRSTSQCAAADVDAWYWITVGKSPPEIVRLYYDTWIGTLRGPLRPREFRLRSPAIRPPALASSLMTVDELDAADQISASWRGEADATAADAIATEFGSLTPPPKLH